MEKNTHTQRTDSLHNLYNLEKQALPENSLLWQQDLVYYFPATGLTEFWPSRTSYFRSLENFKRKRTWVQTNGCASNRFTYGHETQLKFTQGNTSPSIYTAPLIKWGLSYFRGNMKRLSVAVTVGLRKTELWSTRFVYYVHINITLNTPLQSLLLTQDSETPYAWLRPVSF